MKYELHIAWLYPDLMSTYGDRGNVMVLEKRCVWRGVPAHIVPITLETPLSHLTKCDLIFMGGAQDRQQKIVSTDFLAHKGPKIKEMIESFIPALFVCAAYQFVGKYYRPYQGDDIPGADILNLVTHHPGDQAKRLIGNVVAELSSKFRSKADQPLADAVSSVQFKRTIVGFENHGGRTYLGEGLEPLARVIKGFGNNEEDKGEGVIYKNVIGSYFHGPLLPKNPHIADWLLEKALEVKYKKDITLTPLDDVLALKAHTAASLR